MSVLENPEVLKNHTTANRTHNLPLTVYKSDYVIYPSSREYERKSACILAESPDAAERMIVGNVKKGIEIQWESRAGHVCEVHGISPALEKALYLYLKRKFEGPLVGDKLAQIKRGKK